MEKDHESRLHHQQLDEQFPNAKSSKLPFDNLGMRNSQFPSAIPSTVTTPTNGPLPIFGSSGLSNVKPCGWFYCLPRFRQGLIPDKTSHDKFLPITNLPGKVPEKFEDANASKQFLVFDQTDNKTTMIFSSGVSTSIPRPPAWSCKPTCFYNFNEDELKIKSDEHYYSQTNLRDDLDEEESDMREDSDEINALLYSDEEDDYSENGEETSTGHSPNTMTVNVKRDWLEEEDMDEVATSAGPIKRRKLSSAYEEDAESTNMGSLPDNKRKRLEKIRETVTMLQTILPSGKGKDTVMILDEAINYLKTLKWKAKSLNQNNVDRSLWTED